jgi:hypothetical protein
MQQKCEQLNFAANIVPIVLSTIFLVSSRYDERNKILFWSTLDVKGSILGLILYYALTSGLTKSELIGIDLSTRCMVLIGCLRYEYMNYLFIFLCLSLFFTAVFVGLYYASSMHFEREDLYGNISCYSIEQPLTVVLVYIYPIDTRKAFRMDVVLSFPSYHLS